MKTPQNNEKTEEPFFVRQRQTKEAIKTDKDTHIQIEEEATRMGGLFIYVSKYLFWLFALMAVFCWGYMLALPPSSSSSSSPFEEDEISRILIDEIKAKNIDSHLKELTSYPHMSGEDGDAHMVKHISNFWTQLGMDKVNIIPYNVLLSSPNRKRPNFISVVDTAGNEVFKTFSLETPLRDDLNSKFDPLVHQGFNAYSASATVQGTLVYINYGRVIDFKYILEEKDIDLKGKICLIRYGFNARANKVKLAEEHGCIGVIIFSDPDDYVKNVTNPTYPNSWWLPGQGVQRGTIKESTGGMGDPLTPFYPSTPEAYRIPQEEADSLPTIPCQPIGYNDALNLLAVMDGSIAPRHWQGLIKVSYHLGPQLKPFIAHVTLSVNNAWQQKNISNVVAFIRGAVEPDRYVMIGNHHDAWVYGGTDPNSGTAVMLEVSRAVLDVVRRGVWKPRRTLIFCSWGAEEQGLIGSREFVEQYGKLLSERAVAYLNVDSAVQGRFVFKGGSLPLLNQVMYDATKKVRNPDEAEYNQGRENVYDTWLHRTPDKEADTPRVGGLGSGSDYAPFVAFLGVPCVDMRFYYDITLNISSYPLYHTSYDNYHSFSTYHDPGFKYSRALGQVWAEMLRSLSSQPLLPFIPTHYSQSLSKHYVKFYHKFEGVFDKHHIYIDNLTQAVNHFATSTREFELRLNSIDLNNVLLLRGLNDQLMQLDRAFIDYMGLPGRLSIRNVLWAPSSSNSYAASVFPGLSDAIVKLEGEEGVEGDEEMDELVEGVKKQVAVLTFFVKTASATLHNPLHFAE